MERKPRARGIMIVVVGPSGAGKDSLINASRIHYRDDPRIGFVRRVITRPADGTTEDHLPVTRDAFTRQALAGCFALSWEAHGLLYGIPAATIDEIAAGRALVCNGSRAALTEFSKVYERLAVLEVTASPGVIAERLARRSRESAGEIARRIGREPSGWRPPCPHIVIDNGNSLEAASRKFIEAIRAAATL